MSYYSQILIPLKHKDIKDSKDVVIENLGEILDDFTSPMQKSIKRICTSYKLVKNFSLSDSSVKIEESRIFAFSPYVSFLCLDLSYNNIHFIKDLMKSFSNQVWTENIKSEELYIVDFLNIVIKILDYYGMKFFSADDDSTKDSASILKDAYTVNVLISENDYNDAEIIKTIAFNLHKFENAGTYQIDTQEEGIKYVMSAKNEEKNSYRWGGCISSYSMGFVISESGFKRDSIINEIHSYTFSLVLVLQQYYGVFCFSERINEIDEGKKEEEKKKIIDDLIVDILEFRANNAFDHHGTFRWSNVQNIMGSLSDIMGIESIINGLDNRVSYLDKRQSIVKSRNLEHITNLMKIFGLVTVLGSIYTIVGHFTDGFDLQDVISIIVWFVLLGIVIFSLEKKR